MDSLKRWRGQAATELRACALDVQVTDRSGIRRGCRALGGERGMAACGTR